MNEPEYDLVVVGAGIAGLAIAEIFSRAGQKVLLIEKNSYVCQESSGHHHEWFHFGSLYSIFPQNHFMRTLVGGIDDLLAFYSDLPGMNIKVAEDGKLQVTNGPENWIRDEPIDYIVAARNSPDFSLFQYKGTIDYAQKLLFLLTWEFAIKQFISRHQRFHNFDWRSGQASQWVPRAGWRDYSRDVIHHVIRLDAALDRNTHFLVPGFDRPMNSEAIISDLLRSYLSHGGELRVDETALGFERRHDDASVKLDLKHGGVVTARKAVLSSGKWLQPFLTAANTEIKVLASPLLVVYPQVCRQNFVRLTPFTQKTVNHLCHTAGGRAYSLIGGGYSASADDPTAIEQSKEDILAMAKGVFPDLKAAQVAETYVSYKSEIVAHGKERNYQYQLREVADNTYIALPGKFSLAFSLAVNSYRRIMQAEPPARLTAPVSIDVSKFIRPIRHRRIILDYLKEHGQI